MPMSTMSLRITNQANEDIEDVESNAFLVDPSLKRRSNLRIALISMVDEIEGLWNWLQLLPPKIKQSIQLFQHTQHVLYIILIISLLVLIMQGNSSGRMLSTNDSLGLIQIPDEEWGRLKALYSNVERHKYKKEEFIDDPNVWYQYNYPVEFICPNAQKIGKSIDGADAGSGYLGDGKWVCNPRGIVDVVQRRTKRTKTQWVMERFGREYSGKNGCVIYSIGVNGNQIEFESGIQRILSEEAGKKKGHKKGKPFCEIHVFDPAGYHEQLLIEDGTHYHNWGIVSSAKITNDIDEEDGNLERFKTFQETIKELGHQGYIIDVMKVDCKMCEWGIYDDWFGHGDPNSRSNEEHIGLGMVQQLLVELHGTPEEYVNDFFETMRDENYVIFHKDSDTQTFQGMAQDYAFLKLDQSFF